MFYFHRHQGTNEMNPNIVLTDACIILGVETLKADAATHKKWLKFADTLRADGVSAEMLDNDADLKSIIIDKIVMPSFTKIEQAIYAKPRKSLSDEEKVTARFVTTERASKYAKIVRHVRKAEQDEMMSDDERDARRVASLETRLKRDLTKWIEKIEKAEAVTFSATKMLEHLKNASAMLK
jgi:hypothetical protein